MQKLKIRRVFIAFIAALSFAATALAQNSFLGGLTTESTVASTVPANGDVNPYGVARVPATTGKLVAGDILVSNFNDSSNLQGTGTTIVQISPAGAVHLFAQINSATLPGACPGGVGLTTALVALRTGWVIVGSLPTSDGTAATAKAGCLIVLNSHGVPVETISGGAINGPWDMTALDGGGLAALFVTNVLNGTVAASGAVVHHGTVLRIVTRQSATQKPQVQLRTVIGSGFAEKTDPAALVVGPTGVVLDGDNDVLYVNDSVNSRIQRIVNPITRSTSAGVGTTLSAGNHLNDPLGLTRVPSSGHLIAANGGDGNLVEVTPSGVQVATKLVDSSGSPPGSGALFGLVALSGKIYFVDDATNTLQLLN
jgi:hypothetical protein